MRSVKLEGEPTKHARLDGITQGFLFMPIIEGIEDRDASLGLVAPEAIPCTKIQKGIRSQASVWGHRAQRSERGKS